MSIALITNIQDESARKFAEEFSTTCGEVKANDHVIFYTDTYDKDIKCDTSIIDSHGLWTFRGTAIITSMDDASKFFDITSDINFIYYPELDSQYNPITCLFYKDKYSVHCIHEDTNKNLCRTLGSNLEVHKHTHIKNMLETLV